MAQENLDSGPSMDDILSSIRKIIWESEQDDNESVRAEDLEELSDIDLELPSPEAPLPEPEPMPEPAPKPRPQPQSASPRPSPAPPPPPPPVQDEPYVLRNPLPPEGSGLMSDITVHAARQSLSQLGDMPVGLRSVEQLMMEMMRPILKEWLDGNLPHIVERLVREEIYRLTNKSDQ